MVFVKVPHKYGPMALPIAHYVSSPDEATAFSWFLFNDQGVCKLYHSGNAIGDWPYSSVVWAIMICNQLQAHES